MKHALIAMIAAGVSLLSFATASPETAPGGAASLEVTPATVGVHAFFNGATLRVEGFAPAADDLALVLSGPRGKVELKRKGKVWGVLWMNVGEVSFQDVPSVYMLAASRPLCDLAPSEVRARLGLGTDALAAHCAHACAEKEGERLFAELVKLKQHEGLYGAAQEALLTTPPDRGKKHYSANFSLPARIPVGTYSVVLWGFAGGAGTPLAEAEVRVASVGVIHDIAELARTHGLLYGVLAVVIALVTGLITGVVFGLGGKKGH
jgi:uncharacterized protein (TIGR02186 family)